MDVDDLFGAFDGEEKVSDVQAAEPCAEDGKRKAGTDKDSEGQPVAKRQALPVDADAKHELDPVKATDGEGGVELKEGVESSTLREDGTFVKSVRTMHCWRRARSATMLLWQYSSRLFTTSYELCPLTLLRTPHPVINA